MQHPVDKIIIVSMYRRQDLQPGDSGLNMEVASLERFLKVHGGPTCNREGGLKYHRVTCYTVQYNI